MHDERYMQVPAFWLGEAVGGRLGMEWIAVKDRVPEFGKEVLGLNRDGCRVVTYQKANEPYWSMEQDSCGCCGSFDSNITHWMPLPPDPPCE